MNEYEKQAKEFAKKNGVKLVVNSNRVGLHFQDDKEERRIFNLTLSRNGESYTFDFGQSINNSHISTGKIVEPTMYDVLSCLTKYDPETFEDFCSDYGYDEDSRKAFSTYEAVLEKWENVSMLFGDVMEELQEIQ